MKKHNQKGLAHLAIILFLIIFGLIGFTGWWVWSNNHKNSASPSNNNSSISNFEDCKKATGSTLQESFSEVCVTKDGKSFTESTPSSTQQYLTIKEWGTKIPVSDKLHLKYIHYGVDANVGNPAEPNSTLLFTSKELDDVYGVVCKSSGIKVTRGLAHEVYDGNNPAHPTFKEVVDENATRVASGQDTWKDVKLSDYYYVIWGGGSSCHPPNDVSGLEKLLQQEDQEREKIAQALQSMTL